ncbi:transcriptional regulator ATRX isoform X4 [Dendroctonus ponderosae]|uniref:transcriptional regulator ATRX isoform X4 n=1 Tax=Dendroctonus ponderosae TaxID=77166 RepID=UPI0020351321|nr:transcriptional regulator ATRX isoform X4 [Dendroctonus ponderosae]
MPRTVPQASQMNQQEFEAIVVRLEHEIKYMGLSLQEQVTRCAEKFRKTGNTPQYIQKIANILEKFDEYVKKHACSIQKRIEDAGLQDKYADSLKTLRALSSQDEHTETVQCSSELAPIRKQTFSEADKICNETTVQQPTTNNTDAHSSSQTNQEGVCGEKCIPVASEPVQSTEMIQSVPIILSSDSDDELNSTQAQTKSTSSPNVDNMSINSDETVRLDGPREIDSDNTIVDPTDMMETQLNSRNSTESEVFNGPEADDLSVVSLDSTKYDQSGASGDLQPDCKATSNNGKQTPKELEENGGAESSDESNINAHFKSKMNDKDRKLLFTLIGKFFKDLQNNQQNNESSSDEAREPVKKGRMLKKIRKKSRIRAQTVDEKPIVQDCSIRLVKMNTSAIAAAANSSLSSVPESEETENEIIKFRRKKCRPIPSDESESQLGSEQERTDSNLQDSKRKRPSSNSESFSCSSHSATKIRKLSSTGDNSDSAYCMDSKARDRLLNMLIEQNSRTQKASDSKEITAKQGQKELGDSAGINLLQQKELDGAAEDALLKTDSDEEDEIQSNPDGGCKAFKFTESQRSKLLDLLTGVVENGVIRSDAESSSESHVDNKRTLTVANVSREELNQLLSEFEETVVLKARDTGHEDVKCAEERVESSDPENDLIDILREEVISTKRGPGRPRKSVESWNAFNSLMKSEDDISDSSSSISLFSDLEAALSDQEETHEVKQAEAAQWEQKSAFKKELIVIVRRLDLSKYETSQFSKGSDDSDCSMLRPCNLDNAVESRGSSPASPPRGNWVQSTSSEFSGSSLSSFIASECGSDVEYADSPEDCAHLAKSLWDKICSSSDEKSSVKCSTSSSSASEEEEESSKDAGVQKWAGQRKRSPSWCADPLLRADPLIGEHRQKRKRSKTRIPPSPLASDSDATYVENARHPKRNFFADLSDDSDFEIIEGYKTPEEAIIITDEEEGSSSKKGKGRRNIRAVVEDQDLAEATQRANNEERERIKRLQEREKSKENCTHYASEEEANPLILDALDSVEVKVHPSITKKLKPHQRSGIQFMWDSCYESIKQLKMGYVSSGCILAHCMGLGKTLQALALIEALFRNPITNTKYVLVVCPLSTVSNWRNEFNLAYEGIRNLNIRLFTIEDKKTSIRKFDITIEWRRKGGVLVLGYECFGMMINQQKLDRLAKDGIDKALILQALVDPGPDLVICDEGHLLRNKQSQRTVAMNQINTKRRIVLTGTPLQNNLLEYYCMVNFVKPSLLGTEKEYKTNFANPITNGQFEDSTAEDIMLMKKRTHVLHKILHRTVQRVEDTELKRYLPKLIDQAVFIQMSDLQVNLYNTYLDSTDLRPIVYTKSGTISRKNFLADMQVLQYICSHPNVLTTAEKTSKAKIKEQDVIEDHMDVDVDANVLRKGDWHKALLSMDGTRQLGMGTKFLVAIGIVKEAAAAGDKVLIFTHSYAEMDNLELFLSESLQFVKYVDYYRMDGTIIPEARSVICNKFNDPNNSQVKALIVSTRVGGLGLNLTAANRVIIMNVSWNPSNDTQSVFRAFRFGQEKPVFVYRLIAIDTMEEKIYQRVVTKLAVAHRVVDKHQITRHYTASDIQEYYAIRPRIRRDRPLPNVPEDRVLANLVRKHEEVFRWHEHQALLANRPEEDLNEQQKNAAWEEFYNRTDQAPPVRSVDDPSSARHLPGPSGMQARFQNDMENAASAGPGVSYTNFSNMALRRVLSRLQSPWSADQVAPKAAAVPQANVDGRPIPRSNGSNFSQNRPDLNPMNRWGKIMPRSIATSEPSPSLANAPPSSTSAPICPDNEVEQVNSLIKESLGRHALNLIRETLLGHQPSGTSHEQ